MSPSLHLELQKGILNYPILYIPHYHQKFIVDEINSICDELSIRFKKIEIECTYTSAKQAYCSYIIEQLSEFLNGVCNKTGYLKTICVIRSVTTELIANSQFLSLLHLFARYYEESCKAKPELTIVLCVPSCEMPPSSISGITYVVSVAPPTTDEIGKVIKKLGMRGWQGDSSFEIRLMRAVQGLHLYDIRQILMSTKNTYGGIITNTAIKWAQCQKQQLIRKTGILEVIEPDVTLDDVGGLQNLIERIEKTARVYRKIDLLQNAGVPLPKGFLLLGMPGCGKSMIAKATAKAFDCPLIKLDMGKLLGKYVGDSEHNLQLALEVVDSAHPCVLWIDEIEKAFAGTNNASGDGDSVMMRLMGKFLSWMQERETAVFIMATANDVLKPELMRKGRFDEVFFVDFPSVEEADQIIKKIVGKYKARNVNFLNPLIEDSYRREIAIKMAGAGEVRKDLSRGLSGAEIKAVIDTFVVDVISEKIEKVEKNAEEKEIPIDMSKISFDKEEFEKTISIAKKSAMILQKTADKSGGKEKLESFIDKIYSFKDKYQFLSASQDESSKQ